MSTTPATDTATPELPSPVSVSAARAKVEILEFFRQREQLVFTLLFPVLLLLIFGAVLNRDIAPGVTFIQYFTAGIVAAGVLSASFQNLAITISLERTEGLLKRLAGTPMPKSAYFLGKVAQVLVVNVLTTVLLLAVAAGVYGVNLPTSVGKWVTFVWVSLLGLLACALSGIAFSSLIKNGKTAPAVITPIAIVLQFVSGVFFQFSSLPSWMQSVASVFPLKWMAQGMRSVFLPESFARTEPAGTWELGRIALFLGLWSAGALVLCVLFFRWRDRADG